MFHVIMNVHLDSTIPMADDDRMIFPSFLAEHQMNDLIIVYSVVKD